MAKQKPTLNQADLEIITEIVNQGITNALTMNNAKLTTAFATKEDLRQLREDLKSDFSHLPSKDEFYSSQDDLVTRLKKIDENTDILSAQVEGHEERIQAVETKLNISTF